MSKEDWGFKEDKLKHKNRRKNGLKRFKEEYYSGRDESRRAAY